MRAGVTVGDLVDELGSRNPELARVLLRCSFLCDGVAVHDKAQPLQSGNTIDVLAAVRRGIDPRYAEPTHSSLPSAKNWCFHTGSRSLMASTSCAQVSNAAWRWSAATATTRAASPMCSTPIRWLAATARTPADLAATSATTSAMTSAADGCAEYSSLQHLPPAVVVANRADESHDGSRRVMAHQFLVFGQQDRLIRQRGAHHPGDRRATTFHDKQLY